MKSCLLVLGVLTVAFLNGSLVYDDLEEEYSPRSCAAQNELVRSIYSGQVDQVHDILHSSRVQLDKLKTGHLARILYAVSVTDGPEILEKLIRFGFRVPDDPIIDSCIQSIIKSDEVQVMQLLFGAGLELQTITTSQQRMKDPFRKRSRVRSPLDFAMSPEMVQLLSDHGADPNYGNPLATQVRSGNLVVVQALCANQALDVEQPIGQYTSLQIAILRSDVEMVLVLLARANPFNRGPVNILPCNLVPFSPTAPLLRALLTLAMKRRQHQNKFL